ncbi:MAG: hypothetical protein ACKO85_08395 [Isosphaeraceae bacterium]
MNKCLISTVILLSQLVPASLLLAYQPPGKEFENPTAQLIIQRSAPVLASKVAAENRPGYMAMCTLALLKSGMPRTRPEITDVLRKLSTRVTGSFYNAAEGEDKSVYEAAALLIMFANADPEAYKRQVEYLASFIISKQTPSGSWGYVVHAGQPGSGDTSLTQFALLGLWEATNLEIPINANVFDRAATWLLRTQRTSGGFTYQPGTAEREPTVSLTAAGTGSLLICQSQLAKVRTPRDQEKIGNKPKSKLLITLDENGDEVTEATQNQTRGMTTSMDDLRRGIQRGMSWLSANFGVEQMYGETPYYALYSIERVASLNDVEVLGTKAWYDIGLNFINGHTSPEGMFSSQYGDNVNTAWAILFAARSTRDSIQKAEKRRLGAANMLGGKGLPKNLNDLVIRAGRVGVSPMTGAVEGMLDALADPKLQGDPAAIEAGLMNAYSQQGEAALKPHKDRLIRLSRSPDPQLRVISVWCLSRMNDRSVLPLILDALEDADDAVAIEAGKGLQFLSRRLASYGPEITDSADRSAANELKRTSAKAWRDYFSSAVLTTPAAMPSAKTRGGGKP